ncbi:MAG TPA: GGDEF domain-containing protein [Bdellovibrionota bacterium]|nr:GGDEF domain-containing protein [Bdellovibrionota bacterium]
MLEKQESLEAGLKEIRHLLSHLHGEVTALEESYRGVLSVLRKLEGNADLDDLTGLNRRRSFFQKWQVLLDECQRIGDECGVLMIDIDHFKRINDAHGHPTGDEVIKRVASLLKQYESPACVVSRIGGEEFAVAVRGTDAEVLGVAEFIRRGAERLHGPVLERDGRPSKTVEWKCTLSVGMASTRKAGFDAPRLLTAADQALYIAKKKGRNQVSAA